MRKITTGEKYYTFKGDSPVVFRVIKTKNELQSSIRWENTNIVETINNSEISSKYILLKPDGYISSNIVEVDNGYKDVLVTLFRRKDLDQKMGVPFAACRQNIMDIFTLQTQRPEDNNIYIGLSVNINNIPEDVAYETILGCHCIPYNKMVAIYLDDTFDSIFELINNKKFDEVLSIMKNQNNNTFIKGYCDTLKQLLTENNFMFDFYSAFDITKVAFDIEVINDELHPEQVILLEDIFKCEMFKTYVIKYGKDINLNDIQRSYNLISDNKDNLYIVAYDKGEYINRYYRDNIKDKRDSVMLLKHMNKNKQPK
ncbi:MAG: hypothetical protein ACRCXT_02280 [Paraclostridium sp.]